MNSEYRHSGSKQGHVPIRSCLGDEPNKAKTRREDKMSEEMTVSKNGDDGTLNCSRRSFLKLFGAGGAMALLSANLVQAAEAPGRMLRQDTMGVLVDTTLCIGCRVCETACNEVNGLPRPKVPFEDDDSLLEQLRDTSPTAFTVVNKYTTGKGVAKDEVEGYKWFLLAANQGDELGKTNVFMADHLLSQEQCAEGRQRATNWIQQHKSSALPRE